MLARIRPLSKPCVPKRCGANCSFDDDSGISACRRQSNARRHHHPPTPAGLWQQHHHPRMNCMSEIHDECGVAAIYHLPGRGVSPLCTDCGPDAVSRLMPRMLLDIQNRGQLAAGMSTYYCIRKRLIGTFKDVGAVAEVRRMNHRPQYEGHNEGCRRPAAIGHVSATPLAAATTGSYAQPFERPHIKTQWFGNYFNGQLAN